MKVMCINNKPIHGINVLNTHLNLISEGETYTVEQFVMTPNKIGMYILKEVTHPDCIGYSAARFIPTSDIDETEMERNYEKEKQLI